MFVNKYHDFCYIFILTIGYFRGPQFLKTFSGLTQISFHFILWGALKIGPTDPAPKRKDRWNFSPPPPPRRRMISPVVFFSSFLSVPY